MSKAQPIRPPLDEATAPSNPFPLFASWLQEASASDEVYEHNAMTLATATPDGQPAARIVLMRNYDERGFCFYTNYASRKGLELAENARAALLFWWGALGRQVRIEGNVERLNAAESDAYYHSRPLGSRLGAWVSPQSQVIASRTILEEGLQQLAAQYADQPPPRPADW
ncbi:MAG TPA: pyridoxamine 5'-phosphate oxidase, partial [Caldilineaceae bacterium]|nr:pyridoxamine 5'-phosphate oxidase [Caldilineaceae bacterium]